jgi:hypothetical protein
MKSFLFSLSCTFLFIFSFSPNVVEAQIVSLLINSEKEKDSLTMEIEMKKHLKAEGYEVKEITSKEGFFLYVQFMPIKTVREQFKLRGYVGNVFIGSQAWTKVVDSFFPPSCDMAPYQKIKNNVGMEMVLLDSQLFADSSIEALAETMSTRANRIISRKSAEMTALITKLAQMK